MPKLANFNHSSNFWKKQVWTTLEKRMLVEPDYLALTVEAQCEPLGLPKSSYYYAPIQESYETLTLMRRMEEMHYNQPEYGYRKIHADLRGEGFEINEKRMERLWCRLGFASILPRRNLSKPSALHEHYPY